MHRKAAHTTTARSKSAKILRSLTCCMANTHTHTHYRTCTWHTLALYYTRNKIWYLRTRVPSSSTERERLRFAGEYRARETWRNNRHIKRQRVYISSDIMYRAHVCMHDFRIYGEDLRDRQYFQSNFSKI